MSYQDFVLKQCVGLPYENYIRKLLQLKNAFYDLDEEWYENDFNLDCIETAIENKITKGEILKDKESLIDVEYPFEISFDELTCNVASWVENMITKLLEFDQEIK